MLKRPKILKNRTRRFAIPNILFGIDSKKNTAPQKSKFHLSFTENDLRHPLIQKNMKMNLSPTTRRLKKAHSSMAITDKTLEAHIKKYKLKKKTFSEIKELLKNFKLFYKELKNFVFHVKSAFKKFLSCFSLEKL